MYATLQEELKLSQARLPHLQQFYKTKATKGCDILHCMRNKAMFWKDKLKDQGVLFTVLHTIFSKLKA